MLGDGTMRDGNCFVETTSIPGSVTIPEYINDYKITEIGQYCTRLCNQITEIKIPNTVVKLHNVGISTLAGISKIVFPASIEVMDDYIDYYTNCLEVKFEKNSKLKSVGKYFLRYCLKLEYLELPPSLSYIDSYNCFEESRNLKVVVYFGKSNFDYLAPFISVSKLSVIVSHSYPSKMFSNIPVLLNTKFINELQPLCDFSRNNRLSLTFFCVFLFI